MIRYVVRKEDEESSKVLCMWIAKSSDWRNQGFYESWRILRREQKTRIGQEQKLRDVAEILDAALLEYIVADHNPNVDLQSAFNEYLVFEDAEMVVRKIKRGKYRRSWSHERREVTRLTVGKIYGEREKAWPRFLEKYYPNIKTPIHNLEDGRLAKKIKDEFEEYWNKEYWEERDRESR